MKYLITGGCGFIGSNLAAEVLRKAEKLVIFDNLYRNSSYKNLEWLLSQGEFQFIHGDIRCANDVEKIIKETKPDVVFHLAGQVSMTASIKNPRMDFEVNAIGTHNLLESIRRYSPDSIVIYSSTNKVYGDLRYIDYKESETRYIAKGYPNGFDEELKIDFRSPYGCSKGAADQYVLDYARIFDLNTIVFRHSSVYGSRQFSTYDQGWIGWFCQKALEKKEGILKDPFTISGTGKQVRDILHVNDAVNCYFLALNNANKIKGQVFNIGGGINNSLSLLELFLLLENELNIRLEFNRLEWRESDQKVFIANIEKAKSLFGWEPKISTLKGIKDTINWLDNAK
jgi:CDP-paratose 2-epimerase